MKYAIQHPEYAQMAILPGGLMVTKIEAANQGFTIAADEAQARSLSGQGGTTPGEATYLDQLRALPEAADRPLQTARLAAAYDVKSMPLAKAALFLNGLPKETAEVKPEVKQMTPGEDAVMRRKVEIKLLGRRIRANHGDIDAKREARNLSYALQIHDITPRISMAMALRQAGVDPLTVK